MPFKTPNLTSKYIRELIGVERDEDIAAVMRYADEHVYPILLPETAAFLRQAVMLKKPKKILEIGTSIGYSAMIMLKNSTAELCTVEMDEKSISIAKDFFVRAGVDKRVRVFAGDACEIVPLLGGSYDFIFLDGPKTRYPVFYPYLKRLLAAGGVLLADNVLFNGMVDGSGERDPKKATIFEGIDKYLRLAFSDPEMTSSILPVGDGLCMSIKKTFP